MIGRRILLVVVATSLIAGLLTWRVDSSAPCALRLALCLISVLAVTPVALAHGLAASRLNSWKSWVAVEFILVPVGWAASVLLFKFFGAYIPAVLYRICSVSQFLEDWYNFAHFALEALVAPMLVVSLFAATASFFSRFLYRAGR